MLDPDLSDLASIEENLCRYFSSHQLPIVQINASHCTALSSKVWPIVLRYCPMLQQLNVSNCALSAAALSAMALCKGLKTLCLSSVSDRKDDGGMAMAFADILCNCTALEHLDVDGCSFAHRMMSIVNNMPRSCGLKSLFGLNTLSADLDDVAEFGQRCPHLQTLSCRVDVLRTTAVTLCSSLPELCHLELLYCADVRVNMPDERPVQGHALKLESLLVKAESGCGDDMLHLVIAAVQPQSLQQLSMCTTYGLTDVAAIALASFCPDLRSLTCESPAMRDSALLSLAASCSLIECIDMRQVSTVQGDVFEKVVRCLPMLRHVALPHCTTLSDSTLGVLASSCPRLQYLDCASCAAVTDDSLSALGMHCHELCHLALDRAVYLTDQGLQMLAVGCPLLEHFHADASPSISDRSIAFLAQSCRRLHHVSVAAATQLSLTVCKALVKNCLQICHVDFSSSLNLNDAALSALLAVSTQLSHLGIGFGDQVSLQQLLRLIRSCRRLANLVVCDRHHQATWSGQSHWRRRIRELVRTVSKKCVVRLEGVALGATEQCDIWDDVINPNVFSDRKRASSKDLWWR